MRIPLLDTSLATIPGLCACDRFGADKTRILDLHSWDIFAGDRTWEYSEFPGWTRRRKESVLDFTSWTMAKPSGEILMEARAQIDMPTPLSIQFPYRGVSFVPKACRDGSMAPDDALSLSLPPWMSMDGATRVRAPQQIARQSQDRLECHEEKLLF